MATATDSRRSYVPPGWSTALDWHSQLEPQFQAAYFRELMEFVTVRRQETRVYPEPNDVFAAFHLTPLCDTRCVILGQDPYHGSGQAHGLSFSVPSGYPVPPSLRNILKEMQADFELPVPPSGGNLSSWARQGVLLLNTVLTVEDGKANAHQKKGWEMFTDAVIEVVNRQCEPVQFLLWGRPAQQKKQRIDLSRHTCLESPHPSPLSAYRGFFGSRPFSTVNRHLESIGKVPIDWRLE